MLIARELRKFVSMAMSKDDSDREERKKGSDFDDGASLNSDNLEQNFRGAIKNLPFGTVVPGQRILEAPKVDIASQIKNLPKNLKVKNGGEDLVIL